MFDHARKSHMGRISASPCRAANHCFALQLAGAKVQASGDSGFVVMSKTSEDAAVEAFWYVAMHGSLAEPALHVCDGRSVCTISGATASAM